MLVVSPAVNESAVAFWMSDSDEAIADARSTAERTAADLKEGGAGARDDGGERAAARAPGRARDVPGRPGRRFVRDEDAARYREEDVVGEAERRFGVPVTEVTV